MPRLWPLTKILDTSSSVVSAQTPQEQISEVFAQRLACSPSEPEERVFRKKIW